MFKENNFYNFIVKETNNNFSIVEYGGSTHYYPAELVLGSEVKLKVLGYRKNGAVNFDVNPFCDSPEYIFQVNFIAKIKVENPNLGIVKADYNSHILKIPVANWMMVDEFTFPKNLIIRKKHNDIKLVIDDAKHYKFKYLEKYDFKIIEIIERKSELIVLDVDSGIQYKVKKHFSDNDANIDSIRKFTYVGLDSRYNPKLADNESKMMPEKIFTKQEIEIIKYDHLVNSDLRTMLLGQLKSMDNFWLISAEKYLYEVALELFKRRKYKESFDVNIINKKLCGFMFNKKYFENIPKSVMDSARPKFIINKRFVEQLDVLLNYIVYSDFEDLFEDINNLALDLEILLYSLKFSGFGVISEDQFYESISKINEDVKDSTVDKIISFYLTHFSSIIYKYSSQIFINSEKRHKYIDTLNLNLHKLIIVKLTKICDSKFSSLNLKSNLIYVNFLMMAREFSSINIKKPIQELLEISNNKSDHFKIENNNIICFELFSYDKNFAIISNLKSILFVLPGSNNHLVNYYISNNYKYELTLIDNIKDTLYFANAKFLKSNLCNQNLDSLKIGENIVTVVKTVEKDTNRAFATFYYEIESNTFYEGLIIGEYVSSLEVGQEVKAKIIDIRNDKLPRLIVDDEVYMFNKFNEPLEGEITYKINPFSRCPYCNSQNITFIGKYETELICENNSCGAKVFTGTEIFFKKENKKIFVNKKTIYGGDLDFFENIEVGDMYNFVVRDSRILKINYDKAGISSQIKKTLYNVHPSELINKNSKSSTLSKHHINRFIYFAFLILNDLIEESDNVKSKNRYLKFSKILGISLKHPRAYVLNLQESIYKIIESIKKNEKFSDDVNVLFRTFDNKYSKTVELFPNLAKLKEIIECLQFYDSIDYEKQIELINSESLIIKRLVKLILIKNLIQSDNPKSLLVKEIEGNIVSLLEKGLIEVYDYDLNKSSNEEPENIRILKQIESKLLSETVNYEFKETFKVPVLSNDDHKKINLIKSNPSLPQEKKDEIVEKILQSKNINDKLHQYDVAYSTFKNICALLNTNNGIVIIGVRDDNSLIGLNKDYELLKDFDGFQQYFDIIWNRLMCEPEKYRPYVSLNRVNYQNKEFCFIEVESPNDIQEPCFIYDYKKSKTEPEEKCYIKANASTKSLSPREISGFKKTKKKTSKSPNYVYIKIDSNGFYKIGHSKDPDARRGTLMSQDPGIETLHTTLFPSKEIAFKIEQHLHNQYKSEKERGEWFNLEKEKLDNIINFLDTQKTVFLPENQNKIQF